MSLVPLESSVSLLLEKKIFHAIPIFVDEKLQTMFEHWSKTELFQNENSRNLDQNVKYLENGPMHLPKNFILHRGSTQVTLYQFWCKYLDTWDFTSYIPGMSLLTVESKDFELFKTLILNSEC